MIGKEIYFSENMADLQRSISAENMHIASLDPRPLGSRLAYRMLDLLIGKEICFADCDYAVDSRGQESH